LTVYFVLVNLPENQSIENIFLFFFFQDSGGGQDENHRSLQLSLIYMDLIWRNGGFWRKLIINNPDFSFIPFTLKPLTLTPKRKRRGKNKWKSKVTQRKKTSGKPSEGAG
jgi:hypothetical protein